MSTEFILYGKFDCHPCKAMLLSLKQLRKTYPFEIRTIDIRDDPFLVKQYGSRIPVLVVNDEELCHFILDDEKVTSYLKSKEAVAEQI
jgi:thiol-disulfide isomerase/thioredoxin